MSTLELTRRVEQITSEIGLADNFAVRIGYNEADMLFVQIRCWRKDIITGEMGAGYGGKAYISEHATDSEIVQTVFGLYKGYYEHEARESFQWRGRRVFGPHIATEALWDVARRVDVRSARHVEDAGPWLQPDAAEKLAAWRAEDPEARATMFPSREWRDFAAASV